MGALVSLELSNLYPKFTNLKEFIMNAEDLPWGLRKWVKEHTLHKGMLIAFFVRAFVRFAVFVGAFLQWCI